MTRLLFLGVCLALMFSSTVNAKTTVSTILAGPLDSTGEEEPKQITIFGTLISDIKWSNWGKSTARGVGHSKECHDGKCVVSAGTVVITAEKRSNAICGDVPFSMYRRLRVQFVAVDGSVDGETLISLAQPETFC
jgi:hypothetical protein